MNINETAQQDLEDELFGKRVLVNTRDDWPVADVVEAYRSPSDVELGFRQLEEPHVVSLSPMHHWTEHSIRNHTLTCVLALQVAHLMRREAEQDGEHYSCEGTARAAGKYRGNRDDLTPPTGGRPKV